MSSAIFVDNINGINLNIHTNESLRIFLTSCSILAAKLVVIGLLTARTRVLTGVMALPEDMPEYSLKSIFRVLLFINPANKKKGYTTRNDSNAVNSLANRLQALNVHTIENVVPWFLSSLGMILCGVSVAYAKLFYVFVASRMLHSFIYIFVRKQPYRGFNWGLQVLIVTFQSIAVLHKLYNIQK